MALNRSKTLLPTLAITAAVTSFVTPEVILPLTTSVLTVQVVFAGTVTGGTSLQAWIQTSFDGGVTWVDVMCFAFANTAGRKISSVRRAVAVGANYAATDGTLADNTIKDGLIGDRVRAKITSVDTYAAATLQITAVVGVDEVQ